MNSAVKIRKKMEICNKVFQIALNSLLDGVCNQREQGIVLLCRRKDSIFIALCLGIFSGKWLPISSCPSNGLYAWYSLFNLSSSGVRSFLACPLSGAPWNVRVRRRPRLLLMWRCGLDCTYLSLASDANSARSHLFSYDKDCFEWGASCGNIDGG